MSVQFHSFAQIATTLIAHMYMYHQNNTASVVGFTQGATSPPKGIDLVVLHIL